MLNIDMGCKAAVIQMFLKITSGAELNDSFLVPFDFVLSITHIPATM